ncbi:MAG: hypothetical protein BEU04_03130 [Marine Group III euryarchaeote CG-Bathy1]|uniref:AAA+ ATPase domain-containing protein n=1 Tax=Marine Group III euryarchaeote CG-Bathy1 TaxID=1889001 RepID=A0A1J5TR14_9ARCH|nr:MAG: hypothetical protein BEU04_03130 [Marine Group III euryarchaeote CG-Bathy1]
MVPVKVAISGHPGSGKTSTLLRIAQMLSDEYSIGGFTTHPIKEEGYIVGYGLKNYTTELCDECAPKTQNDKTPTSHCEACGAYEQGIVASKNWDVKPRITVLHDEEPVNLGIQLSVVNKIATKSVKDAIENKDLIIVDEVGKLVSESPEFSEVLTEALDSGKPMILTIHKRSRNPLLQNIRKRDDLRTLEVTPINSAMLPSKVVSILKHGMV